MHIYNAESTFFYPVLFARCPLLTIEYCAIFFSDFEKGLNLIAAGINNSRSLNDGRTQTSERKKGKCPF